MAQLAPLNEQQLYSKLLLGDRASHLIFSPYLRERPATLPRKLISAACIRDHCTNPPVNLPFHPSLTREQDPEILKLLHLRQGLSPNPEGASHLFLVENHGLGFGGADSHPSRFTLGCKPPQDMLEVPARRSQQDHIIPSSIPNQIPSGPWLRLEILSIKIMNRTGDKGQPCRSPTCTGNRSDLLLAM